MFVQYKGKLYTFWIIYHITHANKQISHYPGSHKLENGGNRWGVIETNFFISCIVFLGNFPYKLFCLYRRQFSYSSSKFIQTKYASVSQRCTVGWSHCTTITKLVLHPTVREDSPKKHFPRVLDEVYPLRTFDLYKK